MSLILRTVLTKVLLGSAVAAAFALASKPADAAIVTMSFEATVNNINGGASATPSGQIHLNDAIRGTFTYNTATPGQTGPADFTAYDNAATGLRFTVGRYAAHLDNSLLGDNHVDIQNSAAGSTGGDHLFFGVDIASSTPTPIISTFRLDLSDGDGTAFSNTLLPLTAPNLAQFEGASVELFIANQGSVSAHLTTLADGILPGFGQTNPILPTTGAGTVASPWGFQNVGSNFWVDPPLTSGFTYTAGPGSLFTSILDFPTGFSAPFTVTTGGTVLGTFGPGQSVDFSAFAGGGVSSFSITGISPLADAGNPVGFPLQLAFNTPTADFTMTPIAGDALATPEPASCLLWGVLGLCAGGTLARRTRRGVAPTAPR